MPNYKESDVIQILYYNDIILKYFGSVTLIIKSQSQKLNYAIFKINNKS